MGSVQKCWEECPGSDGVRDTSILPSQCFLHDLGLLGCLKELPLETLAANVKQWTVDLNGQGAGKHLGSEDEWRDSQRWGPGEQKGHPSMNTQHTHFPAVCFRHIKVCHNQFFPFFFLSLTRQRFLSGCFMNFTITSQCCMMLDCLGRERAFYLLLITIGVSGL